MTKGASLTIAIVASALGGLLVGGALVFFVMDSRQPGIVVSTQDQSDLNQTDTISKSAGDDTADAGTQDLSSARTGWETYSDRSYLVDFEYPPEWAPLEVFDDYQSFFSDLVSTEVEFAAGAADYRSLSISTLSDLEFLDLEPVTDAVATLKSVYASKNAEGIAQAPLPLLVNAGIFYNTDPVYVQSASGSYRGVYYFAQIGNGLPQTGPEIQLPALVMVLTNGDEVVQFTTDMGVDLDSLLETLYLGTYTSAAGSCNAGFADQATGNEVCTPASELQKELQDNYLPLADSLQ
ncbi:MAG: hypothetical protein Q8P33_01470 [bacterium]|nr:hypothetical protein [bacterium]